MIFFFRISQAQMSYRIINCLFSRLGDENRSLLHFLLENLIEIIFMLRNLISFNDSEIVGVKDILLMSQVLLEPRATL